MTVLETIIATVVAALLVPIISFFVIQIRKRIRLTSGIIRLILTGGLPDKQMLFTVRHIRDGKDEVSDSGPPLNEDKVFQQVGAGSEWFVSLQYKKNLGFQFKCYVECPPGMREIVISFLDSNGFKQISPDETHPNRLIWFLLSEVPICETVDHYINNFYHPRIPEIVHSVKE